MSAAGTKWLTVIVDLVQYELSHTNDGELLSEFCDRWIDRHPLLARLVIVCLGELLVLHLANLIDPKYDPVSVEFWQSRRERARRR